MAKIRCVYWELVLLLFVGYAIGRIGSIIFGKYYLPHHWIYGVILICYSTYRINKELEKLSWYLLFFGVGLVISDLDDMLALKLIGMDTVEQHFWGID